MKRILMVGLLALAACGSDSEYTWGDAYKTILVEYCNFAAACSYTGETAEEQDNWLNDCIDHGMYHQCELSTGKCDVELADGAEDAVDVCVEAMHQPEYAENCLNSWYGILPEECGPVWDYDPNRPMEE